MNVMVKMMMVVFVLFFSYTSRSCSRSGSGSRARTWTRSKSDNWTTLFPTIMNDIITILFVIAIVRTIIRSRRKRRTHGTPSTLDDTPPRIGNDLGPSQKCVIRTDAIAAAAAVIVVDIVGATIQRRHDIIQRTMAGSAFETRRAIPSVRGIAEM